MIWVLLDNNKAMFPISDQILLDVFQGSIQMKQRDEMLIDAVAGIKDRGFIAILEKTIAINADCIVLLGRDSSFVQTILLTSSHKPMCSVHLF